MITKEIFKSQNAPKFYVMEELSKTDEVHNVEFTTVEENDFDKYDLIEPSYNNSTFPLVKKIN